MSFAPSGLSPGHVVHVQTESAVHGQPLWCSWCTSDSRCFPGDSCVQIRGGPISGNL